MIEGMAKQIEGHQQLNSLSRRRAAAGEPATSLEEKKTDIQGRACTSFRIYLFAAASLCVFFLVVQKKIINTALAR